MKLLAFAARNAKEVLRDPLSLFFGLGFPLVLMGLLQAIQARIPVALFSIDRLAPGLAVFGLSFFTLFGALLVAKDRTGAFLLRLYLTPLRAWEYICGYLLPLLVLSLLQGVVCFAAAGLFGFPYSLHTLSALVGLLPAALVYLALGLLCGSVLSDRQVGGICGALLTNLSAWLSGIWFDLDLVGGVFAAIARALPFYRAVEGLRALCAGAYAQALPHMLWVLGYGVLLVGVASLMFLRQMRRQ